MSYATAYGKFEMKKLFVLVLLFTVSVYAFGAVSLPEGGDNNGKFMYRGFSGGMLLHSGHVQSGNFTLHNAEGTFSRNMQLNGIPFGIGGSMRLHFGAHFRLGIEGYTSEYSYANKSSVSTGWGGILADYSWQAGRFIPFAGGTIGGGKQKNLSLLEAPHDGYDGFVTDENVSYRQFGFLCFAPFVGTEFVLNTKVHLVLKIDYLINLSNPQTDFVTGARVYIGFLFCR
ncbi:MAG: hypothetical protein LBV41_03360 [Cytophagaceae bacterium]|jgi:hypothetical protein|nr:hypothetical protein [Cytophagaceae bacterium]